MFRGLAKRLAASKESVLRSMTFGGSASPFSIYTKMIDHMHGTESTFYNNAKIATCNLNQWALDFEGNKNRIMESLRIAQEEKCKYRVGPELEIPGYDCEDHFYELDTVKHSWEVLAQILESGLTDGMICDFGMPVLHRDILFNARVICLDKKILFVRPKCVLSDDGNYRETRYFTAYKKKTLDTFILPHIIRKVTKQDEAKIGVGILQLNDTEIGHEICEELWQPSSPHIAMGLDGAEIIFNSSGSHFALGRISERLDLMKDATMKGGGAYVYSNFIGCGGTRMYFDGCSMIAANGKFLAIGSRFSLQEVEVVTAVIDLDSIRSEKIALKSRCGEAVSSTYTFPRIPVDFCLCQTNDKPTEVINENDYVTKEKEAEIGFGPGVYLWDYLRRSGACGFFLPLSGGADSTATALIVHNMCYMIYETISKKQPGHQFVLSELRRVTGKPDYYPASAEEITGKLLYTCYMRSKHSSEHTSSRAKRLAQEIGATHHEASIDDIVQGFMHTVKGVIHKEPKFTHHGGTMNEDIALQNLQARSRMVLSYFLTQLLPEQYNLPSFLLVLGSGNLDECLRGYLTKYDCSSADINPIGGFSKIDLKKFLLWYHKNRGIKTVLEIVKAVPTAELRPTRDGEMQRDEDEMGMTYAELSVFGTLRKVNKFGPVAMFKKLIHMWGELEVDEIAVKVKRFYRYYAINRHKMTTITPSIHGEKYGCDDNRYDLRPFLYNFNWDYQFKIIDQMIQDYKKGIKKRDL